jgi:hypothetical protein
MVNPTTPCSLSVPADDQVEGDEYVTLAEAARILRRESNPSSLKSIALTGRIRTRHVPGTPLRFNRADAQRLASARVPT